MVLKDKTGKTLSRSEGEAVMKSRGAITISIYAALLAICTLISGNISGKILSNNIFASDSWAHYQAKSIKQNLYEIANNLPASSMPNWWFVPRTSLWSSCVCSYFTPTSAVVD